jgi:hypothetical protein
MNFDQMEIDGIYVYPKGTSKNRKRYVFEDQCTFAHHKKTYGRFLDEDGKHTILRYDEVERCPFWLGAIAASSHAKSANEFKFDEDIEVSCLPDYSNYVEKVKYRHTDPDGIFWYLDRAGFMMTTAYARKIEPTVIYFKEDLDAHLIAGHEISKKLAREIRAGEHNET